jgi:SAM-dependent methyltransferase
MKDPTQRFSSRVENYVKYRPHYPQEVIAELRNECRLASNSLVADIGSGTGFLAELFLQHGNQVFAVEPNADMRAAGEALLGKYAGFHSVAGRAENTILETRSVDFVVSGQAFHWFDRRVARGEFLRILKPDGWVMIVWNDREIRATPFMIAYEQLIQKHAPDYTLVDYRQVYRAGLSDFFDEHGYQSRTFRYRQKLDYEGVRGRLLSSSYTPEEDHPNHKPMLSELPDIFRTHEINGLVEFEYTTRMYFGKLGCYKSAMPFRT